MIVKPFSALLLLKLTPDIEDLEVGEVNILPPIPTPPVTTYAPVVVLNDGVIFVTAKPETLNISVEGL